MTKETIRNNIINKLSEIEQQENVYIIMAVESGSRAWGFASPDSDYDVRFIYARTEDDYLRLDEKRDVIEWQLDDVYDINGWDLRKALKFLHNSNPTIFEWCASPIVYKTTPEFEQFRELIKDYFSPKKVLYHYWHMTNRTYKDYLTDEEVRIKKYFYAIRPLLAAKWVVEEQMAPPMLFSELAETKLEKKIRPYVDKLLEKKRNMDEMGIAPRIDYLNDYIEKSMTELKSIADEMPEEKKGWTVLNEFFKNCIFG